MPNLDDEQELGKFKLRSSQRQTSLMAAKHEFNVRCENERFQVEAKLMQRNEREALIAELKAEGDILRSKLQQRQTEIRKQQTALRMDRLNQQVAEACPASAAAAKQEFGKSEEIQSVLARLKTEADAVKSLMCVRQERINTLRQLNQRPVHKQQL